MSIDTRISLAQGNSWRGPDFSIGLASVDEPEGKARARFLFVDELGPPGWESDIAAARDSVFPVGGRFLQLAEIIPAGDGGQRDAVLLQPVADAGGIAAPDRSHGVLIEGGKARLGDSWIALTEIRDGTSVTLERWPLGRARSRLSPGQVQVLALSTGDGIDSGSTRYRLVRIQPPAGELAGFVEFEAPRD